MRTFLGRCQALLYRSAGRRGRFATVLTIVFTVMVLGAGPAMADPAPVGGSTCTTPPDVQSPGAGVTNSLMPVRNGLPTEAQATLFEKYGLAGLNFDVYDLGIDGPTGCLPNNESIDGSISDMIANGVMTLTTGLAAFGDSVMRSGYDTSWLAVFDPYVQNVVGRLQGNVFANWAVIAFALIGVLLIFRSRKADMSSALTLVGGGFVVFMIATALFSYPLQVGHFFDHTVTAVTQRTTDAINGDSSLNDPNAVHRAADQSLMNSIYENVLYRAWLSGNFGDPDSATAKQYGADLFAAHAMTWDEVAAIDKASVDARKDPSFGKHSGNPFDPLPTGWCKKPGTPDSFLPGMPLPDSAMAPCYAMPMYEKGKHFQEIAQKIKGADPAAYAYLQGKHGQDRIGYAFLALLAVLLSLPVIIIGSLAMACAFLVFRFVLILAPIIAPVGMVRTNVAMSLFDRIASIAVTAFVWGVGIPIVEVLNGAVFTAKINPVLRLLLLAVIFIVSMVTLFSYAPGFGGLVKKRHAKRGLGMFQSALTWLAAGKVAKAVAGAGQQDPAPVVSDPSPVPPPTVTAPVVPDPTDYDTAGPAVEGRVPVDRGLPEAPVAGTVMPETAIPDTATPAPPAPPSGPTASRVLSEDGDDVYVIYDDEGFGKDPTDFDDGEVYGEGTPSTGSGEVDSGGRPALPSGPSGGGEE